jgi:CelD/BcsL family acetyltransferase involved in cellulose biosynthesis
MSTYQLGTSLYLRRPDQLTADEAQAWDRLLLSSPDARRAFMGRIYATQVAHTGQDVIVLVGHRQGRPVFFLPLQRMAGWVGRFGGFEPVGGVMTDYFGVVAEPDVLLSMPELLSATRGRVNLCMYSHLDESQQMHGLIAEEQRTGLRTRLTAGAPGYWETLRQTDRKLVGDTERRQRKLASDHGDLSFEWQSTQAQADLRWLIESKKSQYERTERHQAPLFDPVNVRLMDALAQTDAPQCCGVLSTLRAGDRLVAAHFGLTCGEVMHVWFPVFDREFASYSPGRILFKHMFEAGPAHGVCLFDRGEGDNQAKRDFANESHQFGKGVWLARHVQGSLAMLVQRLVWRWGPKG